MRARSAVASALLLSSACHDAPRVGEVDGAAPVPVGASTVAAQTSTAPRSSSSAPSVAKKGTACRIVSGEGGPGPTVDASAWLSLPAKAMFSVRGLESGKDLRFEGPGRVRACGGEVALVAEGTAVALPSAGESPGNEQWVASPCAVARWAAGVHRFTSGKDGCTLQASLGAAWLWLPEGAKIAQVQLDGGAPGDGRALPDAVDGWRRIDARRAVRIWSGARSPQAAVVACERAASDAAALAAKMSDAGVATLGELVPPSIAARRQARAACALAAALAEYAGAVDLEPRVAKAAARL